MMDSLALLEDIKIDIAECDLSMSCGSDYVNCVRDRRWFDDMRELGFIRGNRMLSIKEMVKTASRSARSYPEFVLMLESAFCGLHEVALCYYRDFIYKGYCKNEPTND